MENLKDKVINFKGPNVYSSTPLPDIKYVGVFLLAKVIPAMDAEGDVAFCWHWGLNDIAKYNKEEYETETTMYKKQHKMKKDDGETTWFYDFKKGDKKRRCVMTTEIWYNPKKDAPLSPFAMLFGQYFGNGYHITKCRFEDVE